MTTTMMMTTTTTTAAAVVVVVMRGGESKRRLKTRERRQPRYRRHQLQPCSPLEERLRLSRWRLLRSSKRSAFADTTE